MPRSRLILGTLLLSGVTACVSSAVDPRTPINAPNEKYRARLAKAINGSKLWQAYLEHMDPGGSRGMPLVSVSLLMERKVTRRSTGGDYDPGEVKIQFLVTDAQSRAVLYHLDKTKKLDDVIFGFFDENATREDIQRIAFEAAEDDVFPFIQRWLDLSALRAIGRTGHSGAAFVPMLEEQANDPWAEDLSSEARQALKAIQGGG